MIYLDNAATTMQKPEAVAEAVVAAMGSMGNSGRGAGSAALQASRIIYDARVHLTRLFGGTDPSRLIFTEILQKVSIWRFMVCLFRETM